MAAFTCVMSVPKAAIREITYGPDPAAANHCQAGDATIGMFARVSETQHLYLRHDLFLPLQMRYRYRAPFCAEVLDYEPPVTSGGGRFAA
jgi:hypothetical protein